MVDSNKFVILVDMDSVLTDLETAFLRKFREKFPDKDYIPLEERRTWRPCDQYPAELVAQVMQDDFYRHLKPVHGAKEALELMKELSPDVEVYICSTPLKQNYAGSCAEKFNWIRDNLGPEWQAKLIITNDKTLVFGHLLFDDKHDFSCGVALPTWEHVLFTDCHNKHVPEKGRWRLDSWHPKETWLNIVRDKINRWRQRRDYE